MLEKHPDTMTDSELYEKINSWVHTKTPESIFIDYKKDLIFETQKQKIEFAKDISSFANTKGGCLLYGIDEDRQNNELPPIPNEDYGIDPIKNELIDIENILNSIISPPLPELRIRQIPLAHDIGKYVYLIWHPKSWVAPHMVSGFKNNRFYKRGNFKSEPMEEYEVEILYQARNLSNIKLSEFIKNIDYGLNHLRQSAFYLKISASPFYFSPYTTYFTYSDASRLINSTHLIRDKISFLDGITFIGYNNDFVIRTFFNGTFSICYSIDDHIKNFDIKDINLNVLYLKDIKPIIKFIMNSIASYYRQLYFYGPIIINLLLENSINMFLYYDGITWVERMRPSEINNYLWKATTFELEEVFPVTDFLSETGTIVETLTNRIKYGFGYYNFEQS